MKTSAAASRISLREASGSRAAGRCASGSDRVLLVLTIPGASGFGGSSRLFNFAADRPTKHETLDLGGAFVDLEDPLIPVEALDLCRLAVAAAGPDLQRHVGCLVGDQRAVESRLRADDLYILPAIVGLGRLVEQQACGS